jgi:ribosomal protein S12 methylthiotransferase
VPEEVKNARRNRLMELQQEVAFEFGDSLVGYELDVLIDDRVDDDSWVGRSFADAPEIDGAVYVKGTDLAPGMFLPVQIEARQDYDLVGSVVAVEESVDE